MKKRSADQDQQDGHSRSNGITLAEEMVDQKTSQSNEVYGEKKMNFVAKRRSLLPSQQLALQHFLHQKLWGRTQVPAWHLDPADEELVRAHYHEGMNRTVDLLRQL
jgi:hypothetical protein